MILLTGASGTLGKEVAKQLVEAKRDFKCLVRQTSKVEELEEMGAPLAYGDVTNIDSLKPVMKDVTSIISTHTLGGFQKGLSYWDVDYQGNVNLINLLKENGSKKFVFISGLSVNPNSSFELYKVKQAITDILKASGLDYTILKASGFFTDFTRSAKFVVKYGVYPALGKEHKIQGIHQGDLAWCSIDAVDNKKASFQSIPIGGPDILTNEQVANLYAEILGKKIRVVPIPLAIPKTAGRLVDTFTGYKHTIYALIDTFTKNSISDNTRLLEIFDVELHSFRDYLKVYLVNQ